MNSHFGSSSWKMEPFAALLRVEEIGGLTSDDLRSFFSAFGDVAAVRSEQLTAFVEFRPGMEDLFVEAALGYHSIRDVPVFVSRDSTGAR